MFGPLDHVGIVVSDLDTAIAHHRDALGYELIEREDLPDQKVQVAFLAPSQNVNKSTEPQTLIELLFAQPGNSSLKKFIDTRGPGLHHVCYRVTSIHQELQRLSGAGYQLIDKAPRRGSRNCLVAFVHPRSMGGILVELCQPFA